MGVRNSKKVDIVTDFNYCIFISDVRLIVVRSPPHTNLLKCRKEISVFDGLP